MSEILLEEFDEIISRKEFQDEIEASNLDIKIIRGAVTSMIESNSENRAWEVLQNRIINSLKLSGND